MSPQKLYGYALDQALLVGLDVKTEDLSRPTPDTEWNVEALMRHMMYELVWVPDILRGKTIHEIGSKHGGDLLGKDVTRSWRDAIAAARHALKQADLNAVAHLSYADKPIHEYLYESADDMLVHSWDLGQAIGLEVRIDEGAAHTLYDYMSRLLLSGSGGLFAAPLAVQEDASWHTKLLALLGRSEAWASGSKLG